MSAKRIYNSIFKRTSTFALACIVGAVFFERGFSQFTDAIWLKMNKGKQYPDVKKRWAEVKGDDDDDE